MRSKHVRCLLLADDGGALFRDIMMSMLEKTEDCLDAERKVRSVNARNCRVYRARCERLAQYSGSASVANRDFEAEFAASAQHMDCEDQLSARMFLDTALRYLDEWEQHLRQRYPFVSTARTFLRTQHPACVARLAARSARKGATLRSLLAHYHNITPKYTQAFEHIISRCERMLATAVPNFDRHKQVSVERTGTDDDLFPSLFESDSDDEGETPQQQQKQQQQQSTESSIDVTQASFAEFLRGFALQADETVRVELAESQAFSALSQQQQAVLEKMAQRPLQVLKRVDRVLRRWAKLLTQLRLNHAKLRRLGFDSAHAAALHARCRQWQLDSFSLVFSCCKQFSFCVLQVTLKPDGRRPGRVRHVLPLTR
ncbi:MAG: hypothetical protein MHM6MM_003256 [Cercozoa sp. M6MM]